MDHARYPANLWSTFIFIGSCKFSSITVHQNESAFERRATKCAVRTQTKQTAWFGLQVKADMMTMNLGKNHMMPLVFTQSNLQAHKESLSFEWHNTYNAMWLQARVWVCWCEFISGGWSPEIDAENAKKQLESLRLTQRTVMYMHMYWTKSEANLSACAYCRSNCAVMCAIAATYVGVLHARVVCTLWRCKQLTEFLAELELAKPLCCWNISDINKTFWQRHST